MKTAEELNALKNEVETLNKKLAELSDEELTQISGGFLDFTQHVKGGFFPGDVCPNGDGGILVYESESVQENSLFHYKCREIVSRCPVCHEEWNGIDPID